MSRIIILFFLLLSHLFSEEGAFGEFDSIVMQLPISSDVALVSMEITDASQYVEVNPEGNQIIVKKKGIYYMTASGQLNTLKRGATGYIDFWLIKNGKQIYNSNNRIYLSKFILSSIITTDSLILLDEGDTVSVGFSSSTPSLGFMYFKPDNEPASTSFTVTIFKI